MGLRHHLAWGVDEAGLTFDLSQIDLQRLRDEFANKVKRKATALQDIRVIVEQKLAEMLKHNPQRMDYYKRYQAIVADYNREKDRTTIEATFAKLAELVASLDDEQRRAAEEGLSEHELALFDLLTKDKLGKAEREKVKQASQVAAGVIAGVAGATGTLDREGADQGRGGDLYSGSALCATAGSGVHRGGKAAHRERRLSARLAAIGERGFRRGRMIRV